MTPTLRHSIIIGILATSLSSISQAATLISVTQAGSPRDINSTITGTATWNFSWTGPSSYIFDRSEFAVTKDNGISNTETITMTLWSGFGGNQSFNNIVQIGGAATVSTITAGQMTGGYNQIAFMFPAAGSLPAGDYSIQLTSSASEAKDFTVKTGALKLVDLTEGTRSDIDQTLYSTDGNLDGTSTAPIPEPSVSLLGLFATTFLLVRRRH